MFKVLCLCLCVISPSVFATEMVLEIIPLFNRPASELHPIISPLLDESEQIIANGSNLIVKATPYRLKQLKKLIKKLDTRLNNLSITVIQSRTKTAHELNSSANFSFNSRSFYNPNPKGYIHGRFAQTEGLKNTDSTQVIKTLEGRSAYIKTGKTHPIQNIDIYDSGYGYPAISTHTEFIETTTGFLVTPHLTGNQVTLDITPWSENMGNSGIIETQRANTSIRVHLGEWVEIGSISENNQRSRNKTVYHSYSTIINNMRILIKVEKSN